MTARRADEAHDLVLRLLDHQIVGPDGTLLGNVDDLELIADGPDWLVTGLMVGPAALGQRLPGLLGQWVHAVWRRLHPVQDPRPVVIPIVHVTRIDSSVHVNRAAAEALSVTFGLEAWLREYVVSRLPGASGGEGPHEQQGLDPAMRRVGASQDPPPVPARPPLEGARGVSTFIGRWVLSADGVRAGRVSELRCLGAHHDERQEPMRVALVLYTPHPAGSQLGYSVDREQGPALVRRLVRVWQRHDGVVGVEHVRGLDAVDGELRLTESARPRHPHDL